MKENEKLSLVDLGKRLLEASRNGQADVVKQLMTNGAPFTTDWLGTSPLHLAAQHGHTQTADQLLRSGVSRDARTKVDRTPLHMAAQNGHLAIVDLLISYGACVNNKDMLNMTPLHWACEYNHSDIIKLLLQSGAKTDIINKFGKTPLDIAGKKCGIENIALLSAGQENSGGNKCPETQKRPVERVNINVNNVKKRQRTKKFPMTAGSWTGNDGPPAGGGKSRKRSAAAPVPLDFSGNSTVIANGRRLSAPAQFQNAGSNSLRSPTENSIASLVSAAEIVKSKSEAQSSEALITTTQDSSVLDTLATLATANLSHNIVSTQPSNVHVTTVSGRTINVAPLTLPTTSAYALSGLTTPLTPSSLFPMPSPLAALSALTSLSTPNQTSPLPNIAMSPLTLQMPVNLSSQSLLMSGTQLVSSIAQHGSVPAASVVSSAESAATSTSVSTSDAGNLLTSFASAHSLLPQQFLAYAGSASQGHYLTQIPQGAIKVEQESSKNQDTTDQKSEDSSGQEMYVTVQVPQQQVINEHGFALQPLHIIQGATPEQTLVSTQAGTVMQQEKMQDQSSAAAASTSQVVHLQIPTGMMSQAPGQLFQIPGIPEPITLAQLQQILVNQNLVAAAGGMQQVVISPQKIQLTPGSPLQVSTQTSQPTQTLPAQAVIHQQHPQQQQQISQQLLQQSIPQGMLQPNFVTQLSQVPVTQELQSQQLQASIHSTVLLQVQEDFRKLIEQQKQEEDRHRKELEDKVMALEQHSKKYRTELELAQKAAETYRDQLQMEAKEKARLLKLYESPKKASEKKVQQ